MLVGYSFLNCWSGRWCVGNLAQKRQVGSKCNAITIDCRNFQPLEKKSNSSLKVPWEPCSFLAIPENKSSLEGELLKISISLTRTRWLGKSPIVDVNTLPLNCDENVNISYIVFIDLTTNLAKGGGTFWSLISFSAWYWNSWFGRNRGKYVFRES